MYLYRFYIISLEKITLFNLYFPSLVFDDGVEGLMKTRKVSFTLKMYLIHKPWGWVMIKTYIAQHHNDNLIRTLYTISFTGSPQTKYLCTFINPILHIETHTFMYTTWNPLTTDPGKTSSLVPKNVKARPWNRILSSMKIILFKKSNWNFMCLFF